MPPEAPPSTVAPPATVVPPAGVLPPRALLPAWALLLEAMFPAKLVEEPPWPPWSLVLPEVEATEAPPTPASQPPVTVVPPRAKVPPPAVIPPGRALFPPKSVAPPMAGVPAVVPAAPPAAGMPPAAPPISPVDVPSGTVVVGLDSASSLPPAAPAFPLDGLRGSRPLVLSVHPMDRISATVARISVLERMVSPACNHGKKG